MSGTYPELERAIAASLERDRAAFKRSEIRAEARRDRRRRRRWPIVVALAAIYLFVVSPLSLGPAVYLARRGKAPAAMWTLWVAAMPSAMLLSAVGLEGPLDAYAGWWTALADWQDRREPPSPVAPAPGVPPTP